ncbi:MAG: hypothetical protein AAF394_13950, partial [Planctomycetota bacterium]
MPLYLLNGSDIENVKIAYPNADPRIVSGIVRVRSSSFIVADKELAPGVAFKKIETAIPEEELLKLRDQHGRSLKFFWLANSIENPIKEPVPIYVDTIGPILSSVESQVVSYNDAQIPTANVQLDLSFAMFDLDLASAENEANYYIERLSKDGIFEPEKSPPATAKIVNGKVRLTYDRLTYGVYRLHIPAEDADDQEDTAPLQDLAGNLVGGDDKQGHSLQMTFTVDPDPEKAEHVEFPEFLPTAPQPDFARKINPGDKVETRVIRLFYFRDAQRVAQLVNRTAKSLNQRAVSLAEQRASDQRQQADQLTDSRRKEEREAVNEAQQLRAMEREISALETEMARTEAEMRRHDIEIDRLRNQKAELEVQEDKLEAELAQLQRNSAPTPIDQIEAKKDEITGIKGKIAELNTQITNSTAANSPRDMSAQAFNSLGQSIESKRASLDTQRNAAFQANERALEAQAMEDRAREQQFRLEVAAAHEDPMTFAAGDKSSVDPVAQCSVSVIGEGLLQVRGPMKGIDKIRTMVHQIDMPVGQVKVEIATVQLNGENGNRMERPVGRTEAHLKLGRYLTSQSLMMLRQAIVAEASLIAMEVEQGGHYQVDRDRKYLYAFFGRDFIDELYEMDSEFLNSENKLLGLHSMDTVSLQQALFVLALAKNDVRNRILARFMASVRSDLVQAEFDFRRSSELCPYKTRKWLPHHKHPEIDEKTLRGVCINNAQRYHFRSLQTFFGATQQQQSDAINPLQREFIRLAQIFKSRLVAELEL